MKKNTKVAAALTLCGAVLAGAIYYTMASTFRS